MPDLVGPAEHHAKRRLDDPGVRNRDIVGHAQLMQAEQRSGLVQQPQHDLLAVHGSDHRRPDLDRALVDQHRELPVLGTLTLDNVQLSQDLDAARQG